MIIILKHIPNKTTKQNIEDFIKPAIKGGWFKKDGEIKSISMLTQKDIKSQAIQHHSLVEITPDAIAKKAIRKLNKKVIAGKYVFVSEYHIRDWHNDRRLERNTDEDLKNRRVEDRRGKYRKVVANDGLLISSHELLEEVESLKNQGMSTFDDHSISTEIFLEESES